jgi:hypothetical protein
MKRAMQLGLMLGAGLLATGCGSSSGGYGAQGGPVSCSGATPVALTVKNYLSWCSVTVDGQAASTATSQTACVAAGTLGLTATALTGFELGPTPWHHTRGDAGAGEQGTITGSGQSASSATTVTVGGTSACAWVCCETAGLSDCPASDQCP